MKYKRNKTELEEKGYSILSDLYSTTEISQILDCIANSEKEGNSFLKTKDLFAIRQLITVIPALKEVLFNQKLTLLLSDIFGTNYFLTKAIYFDKPSQSNWFVGYHQDLSISVDQKTATEGYSNWTSKKGMFGVIPPIKILEDTVTVRIHLDKTDINNGALKVIPKSHQKGIYRVNTIDWDKETEDVCEVESGGAMLMKPLTLHASNRTTNNKQRRVIHLEFCPHELKKPLGWLERQEINKTFV
ncbi:phytanoyl-CoA dioxygenase family protein [Aquimarina sediminis]|uniref:phytanoyl-CoA dioxygenase family protein n=1 Tax=Aquimarina sediminis TaxID=2070536 RepID=UPI000CA000E0|nr:phytanoyl-CoA dioxygenase family protein [Aquimarina sediminis]